MVHYRNIYIVIFFNPFLKLQAKFLQCNTKNPTKSESLGIIIIISRLIISRLRIDFWCCSDHDRIFLSYHPSNEPKMGCLRDQRLFREISVKNNRLIRWTTSWCWFYFIVGLHIDVFICSNLRHRHLLGFAFTGSWLCVCKLVNCAKPLSAVWDVSEWRVGRSCVISTQLKLIHLLGSGHCSFKSCKVF